MSLIKVNDELYEMPEKLTLGELADFEEITGQGYDLSNLGGRGMLAMVAIAMRRQNPDLSLEDVRAIGVDRVEMLEDPPTNGSEATHATNGNPDSAGSGSSPGMSTASTQGS